MVPDIAVFEAAHDFGCGTSGLLWDWDDILFYRLPFSYFSGSYMEDPADKRIPCDGGTGFCSVCDGSRGGFEVKRRGQGFFIWIGV